MCDHKMLISALAILVGLSGCAINTATDSPEELARTWDSARVRIPGSVIGEQTRNIDWKMGSREVFQAMAEFPPHIRIPVVIYLHGCGGFGPAAVSDISKLSAEGYAVIAPDSFARRYRPPDCDQKTYTTGLFPQAHAFRQAEIKYAAQRVRELPWVDQANVFLMGFSEGGRATAAYEGDEFKGHIITGSTCDRQGIGAPRAKPVLAIVASNDPWFRNTRSAGCGMSMGSRPHAQFLVIPASEHHVTQYPAAWKALSDFLRQHTSKGQ